LILAGLKTGHYNVAVEQPSCRQLAGRDLAPVSQDGVRCKARFGKQALQTLVQNPRSKLAFRELETLARSLLPVLLAFLHTGVASEKAVGAQRRAQFRIELRDRA
jgi:hypothetical protein